MKSLTQWFKPGLISLLLLTGLAACTFAPTRYPPGTTPAALNKPTSESLQELTPLAEPASTPEEPPSDLVQVLPGKVIEVPQGGFRFSMPANPLKPKDPYQLALKDSQVSIANRDESLLISLISEYHAYDISVDDCILLVIDKMVQDVDDLVATDADPIRIGEQSGFISYISGTLFKQPFNGALVAARSRQGRCFTAIVLSLGKESNLTWPSEGEPVFSALLASLTFFQPQLSGQCETSPDPAYGTTTDKPIRVGNVRLNDGLAREEAYLNVLVTTEGKPIVYTRIDSLITAAGDILDVYQLSLEDQTQLGLLYLDMYHFEPLKAPQNFSCNAPIPLVAP